MDAREVTHVSRNQDGTIQALGNPGERWSPRSKEDVIRDIARGAHGYYVRQGGEKVEIGVVHTGGKYLRTDADDPSVMDNLESLPDFEEFLVTSGRLIVSDPCYERKIAPAVERVKNGPWHASIERTGEGRSLLAVCEKEETVGEMEELEVGVDSVQAGIFCDSLYPPNPTPEFRQACREAFQKSGWNVGVILGRGVVTSSGDDGCYKAFVGRNRDGLAVQVRIQFDE